MLEHHMPSGGCPHQLRVSTVLSAMASCIDEGCPAHLMAGWRTLCDLTGATRLRLGAALTRTGTLADLTYRQFSHAWAQMATAVDAAPVPSFRGVAEEDRAAHLDAVRRDVDAEAANERLEEVLDALVEASVPERYKAASRALAVDWTDHETWSRPRGKDDPQPAADPTAAWGHAKRNAPGAKDRLFFGYYAQVATMVADERGEAVPELVRRIAFRSPRTDPPAVMATTLVRAYNAGVLPGDVLADCGYSNRDPQTFASALGRSGARGLGASGPRALGGEPRRGPAPHRSWAPGHPQRSDRLQWQLLLPGHPEGVVGPRATRATSVGGGDRRPRRGDQGPQPLQARTGLL